MIPAFAGTSFAHAERPCNAPLPYGLSIGKPTNAFDIATAM